MSKILPTEGNFLMSFRKNVKLTSVEFMEVGMLKMIYVTLFEILHGGRVVIGEVGGG